jgi:fumarate hydratase class II
MAEMLLMVCAQIIGHDATIAWGGAAGNFELNVMTPVMAYDFLQSVQILANGVRLFAARCIEGIEPDVDRCAALVEQSLALVTALVPRIGYDAAAAIARESVATGKTIRELCSEKKLVAPDELARILDPRGMTDPTKK